MCRQSGRLGCHTEDRVLASRVQGANDEEFWVDGAPIQGVQCHFKEAWVMLKGANVKIKALNGIPNQLILEDIHVRNCIIEQLFAHRINELKELNKDIMQWELCVGVKDVVLIANLVLSPAASYITCIGRAKPNNFGEAMNAQERVIIGIAAEGPDCHHVDLDMQAKVSGITDWFRDRPADFAFGKLICMLDGRLACT